MKCRPSGAKYVNKRAFFYVVGIALLSAACNPAEETSKTKVVYHAVNKDDTASFRLDLTEKAFTGQFEINYHGLYKDSGDVNGIIKGDTLKGTYHYQHYGTEAWYRIPIALLKRDQKLVMGVGEMEIFMNMTFFKKNIPIDYQHPKFIFERIK